MNFVHKFAYSFFDFASYKEFLVQGLGKSVLYIFLVTLIFSTITNMYSLSNINAEISDIQYNLVHNAPPFELKNGLLSVDSDEPIYYKHDGQVLIVDTSGKTSSSALDTSKNGVYMNANEFVIKQNYTTIQTVKFTDLDKLFITNKIAENMLDLSKLIIPLLLLILSPLIGLVENLLSVFLILGPACSFISSFMGARLNYARACTLSFYAMTLPLLLEALLAVAGIALPEFVVVFYIITLIYCVLAIKQLKNIDKSKLNLTK